MFPFGNYREHAHVIFIIFKNLDCVCHSLFTRVAIFIKKICYLFHSTMR